MSKFLKINGLLLVLVLILVACGGDDGGTTSGDNGDDSVDSQSVDAEPTNTPFPTFAYVAPTNPPVFNQDEEATEEASDQDTEASVELDPRLVERGLGRYDALGCAECHGEAGVGVDGEEDLLDFALSEDNFITFMRTGGDLGNDHQFSTDRLSENGAKNLYQYLLSIAQGE